MRLPAHLAIKNKTGTPSPAIFEHGQPHLGTSSPLQNVRSQCTLGHFPGICSANVYSLQYAISGITKSAEIMGSLWTDCEQVATQGLFRTPQNFSSCQLMTRRAHLQIRTRIHKLSILSSSNTTSGNKIIQTECEIKRQN